MILRMLNWRYLTLRVAILALAMLVAWFGFEPLLHHFLVGVGQRIVRAKIDIDEVQASLSRCDLKLHHVQVANPRSPSRNLVECDEASFDVDSWALFARRLVVHNARLSGVRFNTQRTTSGEVDLPKLLPTDLRDELESQLAQLSSAALKQFVQIIEQDLKDDLVSIQLAEELAARWPAEYRRMLAEAEALRIQAHELQARLTESTRDPSLAASSFPQRVREVEDLRRELNRLQSDLGDVRDQISRDREAVEFARRHDEQTIRKKLSLTQLDPQELSEYLLGEELSDKTSEILYWIRLARRFWPRDVELPAAERSSGEDILFPGLTPRPNALVEKMQLDGVFMRGTREIAWRGEIQNLTCDPVAHGQPMVIRAETFGDRPLTLQASLDRTGKVPRDAVVISIPKYPLPARTLGDPERLALGASAGNLQIWAQLELVGDQLTGRVLLQQPELHLTPALPAKLAGNLGPRFERVVGDVRQLQAEVLLSGTLDEPAWTLHSNLGPQLATGLSAALAAELAEREQALATALQTYLAAQQTRLDERLAVEQQKVLDQLHLGLADIDTLKRRVAGRVPLPGGKGVNVEDLPVLNPFLRR
jgi:uncharacterized protein (TIGR03545 family)